MIIFGRLDISARAEVRLSCCCWEWWSCLVRIIWHRTEMDMDLALMFVTYLCCMRKLRVFQRLIAKYEPHEHHMI